MKTKITISFLVTANILFFTNVSQAQYWSQTGANIYPTTITNYVGIGLATPLFPLEVSSYTNQGTLSSGGNYNVGIGTESGALIGGQSTTYNAVFGTLYSNKDILFANYNGSSFDERMRIKSAGNVGVGTATPDVSALLDVNASNKGVLIPRVALTSTSDAATITSPATSLLVYNTNGGLSPAGYWYNAGSPGIPNWVQLISTATSGSWLLTGNSVSGADFIGTTNNADWIIKTYNTEKMRVLAGGNVGIGTAAPSQKLHVVGNTLLVTPSGNSRGFEMISQGGDYNKFNCVFQGGGGGVAGSSVIYEDNRNSMTGTTHPFFKIVRTGAMLNGNVFEVQNASATTALAVANSGNIGIGTAAPTSSKLQLVATGSGFTQEKTSGSYFHSTGFNGNDPYLTYYAGSGMTLGYGTTTGAAPTISTLRLLTNGNVGIGITSPTTKLWVESTTSDAIWLKGNTSGGAPYIASYITAESNINARGRGLFLPSTAAEVSSSWFAGVPYTGDGSGAGFQIGCSSIHTSETAGGPYVTASAKLFIQPAGNVGIGTTSPSHKLTVNGIIRSMHDTAYKNIAGSWSGWSDQRLKKDIASFEDGLNVLRHVEPKTYKFNGIGNLSAVETHIGVIAQDIKPIAPYCVSEGGASLKIKQSEAQNFSGAEIVETLPPDSTGEVYTIVRPLTYNYDGLIYVMINSIKQLDSTNTELLKNDSILMKKDSIKDAEIQVLQNLTTLYDTKFQQMQNRINQLDSVINSCCSLGSTRSMQLNSDSQISDSQVINSKDVELVNRQVVVLFQNSPNPFKEQTTIEYYLPDNVQRAQIIFLEQSGKLIKTVDLTEKGKGVLNVFANDLTNGTYLYSLIVDGQTIETKKMVKN